MILPKRLERELADGHDDCVCAVVDSICAVLPTTNDFPIWTDGEEILCEKEDVAEAIADLIDVMYGELTANTGYYDPAEDERNNEASYNTGYYYVTVN